MRSSSRILLACVLLAGCQDARTRSDVEPEPARPPTLEEFVKSVHIHGVPFDRARTFAKDEESVPTLLAMLEDPDQERHWANIVVTLCIIADEDTVDPILAFIESGPDESLSPARYNAKSSAVMALGYVVNQTGNRKALDYLLATLRPGAWEERGVKYLSAFAPSQAARDNDLNTKAVLGLALSGRPEAARALEELGEPATTEEVKLLRAGVSPVVETALEEHAKIQAMGLGAYYERMHGHK